MRQLTASVAIAAALVLVGCSDSATDPQESTLSRSEAVQLAAVIGVTGSDLVDLQAAGGVGSRASSGPRLATLQQDLDISGPCPLGGEIDFDGSLEVEFDQPTNTGSIDAEFVVTHHGCEVQTEEGRFTLDGRPNLVFGAEFAWAAGQQTAPLRLTSTGNVDWARESGESGSCAVSLVSITDLLAQRRTVEGSFCGFDVSEELTWAM